MRRRPAVRPDRERRVRRALLLKRVLVTGAAGLVGGELCGALAERGHRVTALLRRNSRIVRADGRAVEGVAILRGDLREPGLGLDDAAAACVLAQGCVVHCAADTSLAGDDAARRATNVGGTRNLLAWLARGAPSPHLVHVSTAYVCGARSGVIAESVSPTAVFNNGYEASKAEAEALVVASGLPAAIARPSIVVGRWADGAISRFDNLYGLMRLCGEGRLRDLPAAEDATLDLVPIDHVVGGLVDIVERFEAAAGRVLHLASGEPVPVASLCALGLPGLHEPRRVAPGTGRTGGGDFLGLFAGYLAQDPHFATDNLAALSGRRCPPTDLAFARRLVDAACRAGFIRRDPALARERAAVDDVR